MTLSRTPAFSSGPVQTAAAPVAALSGPATSIDDVSVKANNVLNVIVAEKLKKKVEDVPLSKSIKDLIRGKSTLQNGILGDLQMEFTSAPEKGEELPLEELGAALGVGYSRALGTKYTSGLVSRMVGGCVWVHIWPLWVYNHITSYLTSLFIYNAWTSVHGQPCTYKLRPVIPAPR